MDNPETPRFVCPRCHYHTHKRYNFLHHLNKKYICPNLYSMADPQQVIASLNVQKDFVCDHPGCSKSFSHSSGLWRHKKTHNAIVDVTKTNSHNNNINMHSHNTNTTTTTNSHNNNITTNSNNTHIEHHTHIDNLTVNILPFGSESTSHIENDREMLKECINKITTNGIPDIVEAIYFNQRAPENHNVKVGRKNPPEMIVYRADANGIPSWKSMERTGILHAMVTKGTRILIRYNQNIFSLQQEHGVTDDDRDQYDRRSSKLNNINCKERGSGYAPICNAVVMKAEEHTKN